MESKAHDYHPDLEEMKRLVNEKANSILEELTDANLNYFVREAVSVAESIMEKYVFSIRKVFSNGELAIKDLVEKERFTNYKTGYQQTMLDWIRKNKPIIRLEMGITSPPIQLPEKRWHFVIMGTGTVGAIALLIGHRWWTALVVEMVVLAASYFVYKKEKCDSNNYDVDLKQYESEIRTKKETFVNETISQLEKWLRKGEAYSNELLTTFNL